MYVLSRNPTLTPSRCKRNHLMSRYEAVANSFNLMDHGYPNTLGVLELVHKFYGELPYPNTDFFNELAGDIIVWKEDPTRVTVNSTMDYSCCKPAYVCDFFTTANIVCL